MTIMADAHPTGAGHFFEQMVTVLIRSQKPQKALGTRKMDIAKVEGEFAGWKQAMCEALAYYAAQLRIEAWPAFGGEDERYHLVPGVYPSTVRSEWLRHLLERWNNGDWKDVSDEEFFEEAWRMFTEYIVFPEDIRDSMNKQHRDNVRRGFTPPTAADREWIEEERATYAATVEPYDNLLSKIKGDSNA